MKNKSNFKFTYDSKRRCLFCNEPIPDQAHAARKFCERFVLEDDTIINHHDDYHSAKRKVNNAVYKRISDHHKLMQKRIERLLSIKGETVVLEEINQYGIKLGRAAEVIYEKHLGTFYFIEFAFTQINSNQFKIFRHERLL